MTHSMDASGRDPNIRLDNPMHGINDGGIGQDDIQAVRIRSQGTLSHAVPDDLASSKLDLIPIAAILGNQVTFNLKEQVGIGQAHLVTHGWAVHFSVLPAADLKTHRSNVYLIKGGH